MEKTIKINPDFFKISKKYIKKKKRKRGAN